MENTYFILSNTPVIIDRLHICTWDFKGGTEGAIEIGLEFSHDFDSSKDIKFALALPFLNENDKVECLMPQLILSENSRFIFNDKIMSIEPIKGNERYGATLKFENRILLAIGANILCSLLLEAYSLYTANPKWYIPLLIFSTILIIAYLLSQTKSFKR